MPSSINHVLYDDEKCEGCKKLMADCVCFECPTCHGTGLVNPLSRVRAKDFFCVATTDCPDCDGSGEI